MSVLVRDLDVQGPAYRAGVCVGDRVVAINGHAIDKASQMPAALRSRNASFSTPVAVRRGTQHLVFNMLVGRKTNGKLQRLGIVTDAALVGSHFGARSAVSPAAPAPGTGVALLRVNAGPLKGKLQPGDIVTGINGRGVSKSEDMAAAVKAARFANASSVSYIRQGARRTATAKFGRRTNGDLVRLGVDTR